MPEIPETEAQPGSGLQVRASLTTKLNLADYQNAVPALRELTVINDTDLPYEHLVVSVSSDPCFFKPRRWQLQALGPRQSRQISNLDLQLDGPLLARLSEAESARVKFEVAAADSEATVLCAYEQDVELLPRNHWGGLSHLPEMTAAFVQPNDPSVDRLLKKAAQLLREGNKDPALNGYESGPKHAWEILSAIWNAAAAEKLDYAFPPASFEQTGQKVRSPSQIFDSGLGTCLDLALLFAAAAEQAGLNPLVIFTTGHAFTGCWLRPEQFATIVTDDPSDLRKRLLLKELVVFETTAVTQRSVPPFSRATEMGASLLEESASADFQAAIDIRRARMHKIRPLAAPEPVTFTAQQTVAAAAPSAIAVEDAPDLPEDLWVTPAEPDPASLSPADRIERWQRKLLDLSLRNSLLNFRRSKRAVTFEVPDPGKLEDVLASGQTLRILPRPELMYGADPRSRTLLEGRTHEDVRKQHALEGLSKREIFATVGQEELESTLVNLYRSARSSLEEGGATTLFLALGFLVWNQQGKEQKYRAPLLLIPVTLSRRSVRSSFTLSLHEDEPQFNPTLIEMLRQDFQLDIGIPEGELPKDDSGLHVAEIWGRVSEAIKDIKGWEVVPDVVLSTFSFAKHLMWKDLVHRTDQLRENPVVRHLIDTPRETYRSNIAFVEPKDLDSKYDPRETFCPLPADSSQLAAVMSASRGKDFVLIGPPGTGKSQTIANLIAQLIAEGKRVLFVAEKIAALEVVYRRLREAGLDNFCLEIHSSKAKKASVLAALGDAWRARGPADPETWEREALRLKALRDELNRYVERLHQPRQNGLTVHRALAHAISGHDVRVVDFLWPDPSGHDVAVVEGFRRTIAKLAIHAEAFGAEELIRTPLLPVGQKEWTPLWQSEFLRAVKRVQDAAEKVAECYQRLAEFLGAPLKAELTAPERAALAELAAVLPACVGTKWSFTARADLARLIAELHAASAVVREHRLLTARIGEPWPDRVAAACRKGIQLLRERESLRGSLPAPWPRILVDELERGISLLEQMSEEQRKLSASYDATRVDAAALEREWQKAEESFRPMSFFAKRRIRSALAAAVTSGGRPDPANDLPVLSRLQRMRAEVASIDLRLLPPEVWSGLKTSVDAAKAALRLQKGLALIRDDVRWQAEGVELIEAGFCGAALKQTLDSIQKIAAIDSELDQLEWLSAATEGLWSATKTKIDVLTAALDFCEDWRSGSLHREHDAVIRGDCGESLRMQCNLLRERARVEARLANYSYLEGETSGLWRGLQTDLNEVARAAEFAAVLERTVPAFVHTESNASLVRAAIDRLCRSQIATQAVREASDAFRGALAELTPAISEMAWRGFFAESDKRAFESIGIEELRNRCQAISAAAPRLHGWCSWVQAREEAAEAGLRAFVIEVESGRISPAQLSRAFEVNYSRWWLDHVVSSDEVLRTFVSAEHEKRIADFQALDDRYTALTRDWIRARLWAETPSIDYPLLSREWGILKQELTKKRRHLPLRELMGRIPSVVTTLTPCLLMSPLSVAQYLAVSTATFDVVVFDEASQITVWDAIGAMARAKQVVIVGDPKQLPPTNFFDKADGEENLGDDVPEDMESILDECIAAGLPSMQLSWHYRSRHESLITFSNQRYYKGELVTFPAPVTTDRAVSFHYVNGVYHRGGSRTNPEEAKAVVRDIVARLKSPGFAESRLSIGVVTFNAEQQKLIEDLLDEERRNDPSIEPYFGEGLLEPVFVKNLENVQGDERDVMYFSVTYGPDITGRVSMNFGPMNRDGGERRLNVAITRARRELRVFSSLRPEQIDQSRTQAVGVSELKYFLEFAEHGPRAFAEMEMGSTFGFERLFEEYVAEALRSRGWEIHTQVGVSAFRIDLAVVQPDAPGIYLAGIECDGATYHRSATARDRDKLREQVLRNLGWEILRVWSTDWWIDRENTLNRLDSQLRSLLAKSRQNRSVIAVPAPEDPDLLEEELPAEDAAATAAVGGGEYRHNQAQPALSSAADSHPNAEQFFERSYDAELTRVVTAIVESEGPILDEVLARRIARMHGWQRTGTRITERVTRIASRAFKKTKEDGRVFFWPRHIEPGQPVPFRSGLDRSVEEICLPELVSLAADVLGAGKTNVDAVNAMAKAVGLQRLGTVSRSRLETALARAKRQLRNTEERMPDGGDAPL